MCMKSTDLDGEVGDDTAPKESIAVGVLLPLCESDFYLVSRAMASTL
jgi:hypothetical protein